MNEPDLTLIQGGGGGIEGRLRSLEDRMTKVETKLDNLATKTDIQSVKTVIAEKETVQTRWLVGVVIGAAISLAIALIRTFTN